MKLRRYLVPCQLSSTFVNHPYAIYTTHDNCFVVKVTKVNSTFTSAFYKDFILRKNIKMHSFSKIKDLNFSDVTKQKAKCCYQGSGKTDSLEQKQVDDQMNFSCTNMYLPARKPTSSIRWLGMQNSSIHIARLISIQWMPYIEHSQLCGMR